MARRSEVAELKARGKTERDLGRVAEALACYEAAAAICRTLDDPALLAHTLRHVADLHREAGRPVEAEASAREAFEFYRGLADVAPLERANTIRVLAILAQDAGRHDEALRLWQSAHELYTSANVREGVAEAAARMVELSK